MKEGFAMKDRGHIAVVGAGLVGASWSLVFASAGFRVKVFDSSPAARDAVAGQLDKWLLQKESHGLLDHAASEIAGRCVVVNSLEAAVHDAIYVQESIREDLELKKQISAEIGEQLHAEAFVGSSTSGFPSSAFTKDLTCRDRFLVVHPVNPPHLVPVVEIVPSPWTSPGVVEAAREFMGRIGQTPVSLSREIDGFILNRLQGALLEEAWRLYSAGYASLADIDATVSQGLGMRWSFMGPFETIDLNATGGLGDYAKHLSPMYRRIAQSRPDIDPWDALTVTRADAERRACLPFEALSERRNWRDEMLLRFVSKFRTMPNRE